MIVANPPYIPEGEPVMELVVDHEPHLALFAGEDGLACYRRIVAEAQDHLVPGGWLFLEHGMGQSPAVTALLSQRGFVDVETYQDMEERASGRRGPKKESMIEKLKEIKARYDLLSQEIAKPDTMADMDNWRKLVKEHASLEEVAQEYDAYAAMEREQEDPALYAGGSGDAGSGGGGVADPYGEALGSGGAHPVFAAA